MRDGMICFAVKAAVYGCQVIGKRGVRFGAESETFSPPLLPARLHVVGDAGETSLMGGAAVPPR